MAVPLGKGNARSPESFTRFAQDVLRANEAWIGPSGPDGELVHVRTTVSELVSTVDFEQWIGSERLHAAGVRFVFSGDGKLTAIRHHLHSGVRGVSVRAISEEQVLQLAQDGQAWRQQWTGLPQDPGELLGATVSEMYAEVVEGVVSPMTRIALFCSEAGPLVATYDAVSGDVVAVGPAVAHAQGGERGSVRVHDPCPLLEPGPKWRPLNGLIGDGLLRGKFAWLEWTWNSGAWPFGSFNVYPRSVFPLHFLWPNKNDRRSLAQEGAAYYFAGLCGQVLESLGYHQLQNDWQVYLSSPSLIYSAFYEYNLKSIFLDSASWMLAQDGTVVLHELGHATHHLIGGVGEFGQPFAYCTEGGCSSAEWDNAAAAEALADFLAGATFRHAQTAQQAEYWGYSGFERSSENSSFPDDHPEDRYHDRGQCFSGALWDLGRHVGLLRALQLSIQAVYHVLPDDDFSQILDTCLVQADFDLFGGQHEEVIRRCFAMHGIYGAAGAPDWPAGPLRFPRPYADDVDEWATHTISGASAVRLTFDSYSKLYLSPNGTVVDVLHVSDGTGQEVPGSPFSGGDLANRTLEVPGDTVQLHLVSTAGDGYQALGPKVIAISAVDSANQAPVALLAQAPTGGRTPWEFVFDATPSSDPDGNIVAVSIDPGDGSMMLDLDPSLPRAAHSYGRDGLGPLDDPRDFVARVLVTDDAGTVSERAYVVPMVPSNWSGYTIQDQQPEDSFDPQCGLVGGEWRLEASLQTSKRFARFGYGLAWTPDRNGDGWDELYVGRPGVVGDPYSQTWRVNFATHTLESKAAAYYVSHRLVGMGDVNGDGIPDFLGCERPYGHVRMMSGATGYAGVLYTLDGDHPDDSHAWSADRVPDLNGDGVAEFVLGSPSRKGGLAPKPPFAEIHSGVDGTVLQRIDGEGEWDGLGWAVAGIGDLDGDGAAEVLLGAPWNQAAGPYRGRVSIRSGLDGHLVREHFGDSDGDLLGYVVASIGDVTNDGVDDYALTSYGHDGAREGVGRVTAFSGADGRVIWSMSGFGLHERFGHSIARVGDIDLNGTEDFLIGSPGASGGGASWLVDGETGRRMHIFKPVGVEPRWFGHEASTTGHTDLDAIPELAIADPEQGPNHEGAVHFFHFDPFVRSDVMHLSSSAGGQLHFDIDVPDDFGGLPYRLVASNSGPGNSVLEGLAIPVLQDTLFEQTLVGEWPCSVIDSQGILGPHGEGLATLDARADNLAQYVGTRIFFAVLVLSPDGGLLLTSAFVPIAIED